jgi:chromosome partitioning protein
MSVVAIYNMKGGVGKTTTAVNLSFLAAAAGCRVLLWDLDPQGAASFALRVRPRVEGFSRKNLERADALAGAIKETDYLNLHLLPADFSYRKLDRMLDRLQKPQRVIGSLIQALGRGYDVVFLDCPAGFSLLVEGIFAAADAVLVPTIPTVLSMRTVARLIKWADRSSSRTDLMAFFSMVDRHKALHRRACDWSAAHPQLFLSGQIPYASVVEQMAIRRMPLAAFAPRDAATAAFARLWMELHARLRGAQGDGRRDAWARLLRAIESLIAQLESTEGREAVWRRPPVIDGNSRWPRERRDAERPHSTISDSSPDAAVHFVHRFDTERRDLERCGYVLELRERSRSFLVVAAQAAEGGDRSREGCAEAQIDSCWAMQILSGGLSPLAALERRLGAPAPWLLEHVSATIGGRQLRRVESWITDAGIG